jgi:hypothetical protein
MPGVAVFMGQHRTRGRPGVAVALLDLARFQEGFDPTLVALQQIGVDLAELDFLQVVGDAAF